MKEKLWKEVKEKVCARVDWKADSSALKCQCCSKNFIYPFRRRHHCRFCGKIFCSSCSNYFVNGIYIGLKEKFVRNCEFCHELIQRLRKDVRKMPFHQGHSQHERVKSVDSFQDELSFDSEEDEHFLPKLTSIRTEFAFQHDLIESNNSKILQKIMEVSLQRNNLGLQIKQPQQEQLLCFIIKSVHQSNIEKLINFDPTATNHHNNILKLIKIKFIRAPLDFTTELIHGVILMDKYLPSKKIYCKQNLGHLNVVLIQNSLDLDSLNIKFKDLMQEESKIFSKILQEIVKLNPDVVIVENNVNILAYEFLNEHKIVVINKVPMKSMLEIMRVSGIKNMITNIFKIQKYRSQSVVGQVDNISCLDFSDQKMMVLERNNGIFTFLLSAPSPQIQSSYKGMVQNLLRLYRQLHLEKYLILAELQLKEGLIDKPQHPNSKKLIENDFFMLHPLNCFYENSEQHANHQEVRLTKIAMSALRVEDCKDRFEDEAKYAQSLGKKHLYDICQLSVSIVSQFLNEENDFSLGYFLMFKAVHWLSICDQCQGHHLHRYYFQHTFVQLRLDHIPSNSNSFTILKTENLDLEEQPVKNSEKNAIWFYLSCLNCETQLTNPFKLSRQYLQNSFHYFLYKLSFSGTKSSLKESYRNSKQESRVECNNNCKNDEVVRIFEVGDSFRMSLNVVYFQIVSFSELDLNSADSKKRIQQSTLAYLSRIINKQITRLQELFESCCFFIDKFSFHEVKFKQESDLHENMLALQQINVQLGKQIDNINEKFRIQLSQPNKNLLEKMEQYDWTKMLRKIYKAANVLKKQMELMQWLLESQKKTIFFRQKEQSLKSDNQIETHCKQEQMKELMRETLKKMEKQRFTKTEGTFVFFNSCLAEEPISVLACGLNSKEMAKALKERSANQDETKIRVKLYKEVQTEWTLKVQMDILIKKHENYQDDQEKSEIVQITSYFQDSFQALRTHQAIDSKSFFRSLCFSEIWQTFGGKSNSIFVKSADQLLLVKIVKEAQFDAFHKFAKDYVHFVIQSQKDGMESLLAKIYGLFEISIRGKISKCIVMQNIFFGLTDIKKVYDLKGSENNRLFKPSNLKERFTGLDTNFKIDKDSQPYILKPESYFSMLKSLENDINFLKGQNIIDYSLLLIEAGKQIRIGIIDFMRPYHFIEKLENFYKEMKNKSEPTVIKPANYAERFLSSIKKYLNRQSN